MDSTVSLPDERKPLPRLPARPWSWRVLAWATLAFVVAAVVTWIVISSTGEHRRVPFEAIKWRQARWEGESSTLFGMARDLVATRRLVGLPRSEVVSILGSPDIELGGTPNSSIWRIGSRGTSYSSTIHQLSVAWSAKGIAERTLIEGPSGR